MRYLRGLLIFCFSICVASSHASVLNTGKWVKIRVSKEGVYQLTASTLKQAGFTDPSRVKLYGYSQEVLPEANIENLGEDLPEIPLWRRTDGTLLFYAHGVTHWKQQTETKSLPRRYTHQNNPYSLYHYYLLTEGDNPRPFSQEPIITSSDTISTFLDHALIEKDEYSFLSTGRVFFESLDYAKKSENKYSLTLTGVSDSGAFVEVVFGAAGKKSSTLTVKANGQQLGTLSLKALGDYAYATVGTLSKTWNNASENVEIILNHNRDSGIAGHLDYICLSYNRKLDLSDNYLLFHPQADGETMYNVSSANSATRVWRVTDTESMAEITGRLVGSAYSVGASSSNWKEEEYVAVNTAAVFPEPEVVGDVKNQNLHALKDIDLVIIVPASGKLTQAAQQLADCHAEHDSMRTVVVRADEVYNEFSAGTPDATAYRRLMKHLYDTATDVSKRPKNLCLFGDGVWDNRMVTSAMKKLSQDDYLLCRESENSWSHTDSYVLEEYYTLLADGKGVSPVKDRPDCGVGRIPVTTASQANAVVTKLCSYINNDYSGDWQNTVCMIADDGNYNIHMQDAEAIVKTVSKSYPDIRLKKIYLDSYAKEQSGTGSSYPDVTKEINQLMENGALIMNYTGHGAAYCLSHEQILKTANFENWTSPRLPFWIHAACDVSPFDMNIDNIGETALLNAKGAAVGVLSTTRTVYSSQNRIMNNLFMQYVFDHDETGRRLTLGEALQYAKDKITVSSMRDSINKCHFVMLGDPAITLALPTPYKIRITELSSSKTDTICAGDLVTVKGCIVDNENNRVNSFNGQIYPTVLDSEVKVTCNNNAGESVTPFTFMDRTRTLFQGMDSISNGEFNFSFRVPLDINYSLETGLITLYAKSIDGNTTANGSYDEFIVGGSNPNMPVDTIGPSIQLVLQGTNWSIVPTTPSVYITLKDETGINASEGSVGHNMMLSIDNEESKTYSLNNYFTYDIGSSTSGTIEFQVPDELSVGSHTLMVRAWDILNNSTTIKKTFEVADDYFHSVIYDVHGKEVWNGNGDGYLYTLPKGIYIKKSVTETKKFLIK